MPSFYHNYIRLVTADSLQAAIDGHIRPLSLLLKNIPEADWSYAYAPGKWTLKELIVHIADAERIFSHRALSIARRDPNPLPGFDENDYAAVSGANERSGASILAELNAVDASTRCLFASFNAEQLSATGMANGAPISVQAIGYILTGHALHHTRIIGERYLDRAYAHPAILQTP